MVERRVFTQRSMVAEAGRVRRVVEPLYGEVAAAREQLHLERLQVARPSSEELEPRVQVWLTRTEMQELSQVVVAREEQASRSQL
jgi:hypothetical protein